ncbi:MAG: transposase family protein, partial [Mycolicibacterium hassiacum]
MSIKELVTVLFPHLARVCVDQVTRCGTSVRIIARTTTREAGCPECGTRSRRRHSRYERRLADTAVGRQEVLIHLRVHRFRCGNDACARQTFAEQVPGLTVRYGRRSSGAGEALQAIALALGGRAFDDVILHTYFTPETLQRAVKTVKDAAEQAGRDPDSVRVWSCFATVGDHLPEELRLKKTVARLATYLQGYG